MFVSPRFFTTVSRDLTVYIYYSIVFVVMQLFDAKIEDNLL